MDWGEKKTSARFEVGALLQSAPQVLRPLLDALNAREIRRCMLVCKMWHKYGILVLSRRCRVIAMSGFGRANAPCAMLSTCLETIENEPGLVLAFTRRTKNSCILLTSRSPTDRCVFVERLPPAQCRIMAAACGAGVFSLSAKSGDDDGSVQLQKSMDGRTEAIFTLSIPRSLLDRRDTVIHPFSFKDNEELDQRLSAIEGRQSLLDRVGWPSQDTPIKLMLLMVTLDSSIDKCERLTQLVRQFGSSDGAEVAVVGGIAQKLAIPRLPRYCGDRRREMYLKKCFSEMIAIPTSNSAITGVLFGGSAIRAASIRIRPRETKPEAIRDRLQRLRTLVDQWPRAKQMFGIIFSCCGRETRRSLDEATIFGEVFPNVPLLGMLSQGEIGCDSPGASFAEPSMKVAEGQKSRKRRAVEEEEDDDDSYFLSFHAVIGLIAFT